MKSWLRQNDRMIQKGATNKLGANKLTEVLAQIVYPKPICSARRVTECFRDWVGRIVEIPAVENNKDLD
ncbi:hypothetical protein PAECIP111802_07072 [Paenibacillus allorhizosphaerae]|uniref:Uncharacterized protein n=1 Tax=Paenibacillus allorhizosphaerae TaxID=2849866 RepID=A0ABM8VUG6_9BACL|nr:hypothetical protein PAECIP111802_07072 [Paenibacillus allorhizosphaerae]